MIDFKSIWAAGSILVSVGVAGYQAWKYLVKPIITFHKEHEDIKEKQGKDYERIEEIVRRLDFQDKKSDGIIQLSGKAMFVCNEGGLCTLANQAMADLFGANSVSQLKGFGWLQFIHYEDRHRAKHDWETAIKSGAEDFTSHYRIVHGRTEEIIEASYHSIIGRDHENEALVAIGKVCKT